jgi:hypothetical protein
VRKCELKTCISSSKRGHSGICIKIRTKQFVLTTSLELREEEKQSKANGYKVGFTLKSANRRQVDQDDRRFKG